MKIDNIEGYTLSTIRELEKSYEKMMEDSEGHDPDFPDIEFGGKKGKKVKGVSKYQADQYYKSMEINPLDIFNEF